MRPADEDALATLRALAWGLLFPLAFATAAVCLYMFAWPRMPTWLVPSLPTEPWVIFLGFGVSVLLACAGLRLLLRSCSSE